MKDMRDEVRPETARAGREALKVGVVGLGIMGGAMAANLLRAGFGVSVFNRTLSRRDVFVREGARAAHSPADAASDSDVVITNVTDTEDVEQVIFGPKGVAEGARKGTIVMDMSTISPEATRNMALRLQKRGVAMLDAPVTGGDVGAREATLSIMVGGPQDAYERVLPVLQALGKSIVHVGPSGMGQTVKLVNQVIVALNLLAMAEGLAFAAKSGVDAQLALEVVQRGAAGSWALDHLAPRVLRGDLAPGFMVNLQQKDLRLALENAASMQLPLPGTALVQQLLRSVEAYGGGGDGTQALVTALERLGNFRLAGGDADVPRR